MLRNEKKMKSTKIFLFCIIVTISSCSSVPKNINWDDKRCVTYENMFKRLKSRNQSNSNIVGLLAIMSNDYKSANTFINGGGVHWVEAYSADSNKVWIAYNELGEKVGYKDRNYVDLTISDLERLGPTVDKYDRLAEYTNEYNFKRDQYIKFGIRTDFTAAPLPKECEIN